MLDTGADAILRFPCASVELIANVHALGRQRDAARRFAAACILSRLPQAQLATLSKREREVLRLLACGHTDQQIASALLIAVRTARFHVGSILRKCAAVNRRNGPISRQTPHTETETRLAALLQPGARTHSRCAPGRGVAISRALAGAGASAGRVPPVAVRDA
jgi:DNA-binding NarL/FixJ family response regulator